MFTTNINKTNIFKNFQNFKAFLIYFIFIFYNKLPRKNTVYTRIYI